jgi:hypothetical protein
VEGRDDTVTPEDDESPAGLDENVRDDYFAGEETVEGVLDELSEKEGGPE